MLIDFVYFFKNVKWQTFELTISCSEVNSGCADFSFLGPTVKVKLFYNNNIINHFPFFQSWPNLIQWIELDGWCGRSSELKIFNLSKKVAHVTGLCRVLPITNKPNTMNWTACRICRKKFTPIQPQLIMRYKLFTFVVTLSLHCAVKLGPCILTHVGEVRLLGGDIAHCIKKARK